MLSNHSTPKLYFLTSLCYNTHIGSDYMYTLFISTFDKLITIGLLKNAEVIKTLEKESSKNHSIYVMPMIDELLNPQVTHQTS